MADESFVMPEPTQDELTNLQLYLFTNGRLGELPDWYLLFSGAKLLGVPPWELAAVKDWRNYVIAMTAIQDVEQKAVEQRHRRRSA